MPIYWRDDSKLDDKLGLDNYMHVNLGRRYLKNKYDVMYQSMLTIQDINKIAVSSIANNLKTDFDQGGANELIADIKTGKRIDLKPPI